MKYYGVSIFIIVFISAISCSEDDDTPPDTLDKVTRIDIASGQGIVNWLTDTTLLAYTHLVDFDINDYPRTDSVKLVLTAASRYSIREGEGPGITALYDFTNDKVVEGTYVYLTTEEISTDVMSGNIMDKFSSGRNDYGLYLNDRAFFLGAYLFLYRH
jgi:hypothetical protein